MVIVGDFLDVINMIEKIIKAIETSQKLKDVCLEFKEYLWCVSKNLEQLQGKPLSDITVVTLKRLKDVLEKAYQVIKSSQNQNFVCLMLNGTCIMKQIEEANMREKTNITLQEPHESAPNGTDAVSNSGCSMAQGRILRIFKFKELRSATDDFRHDHFIGTGLFGSAYKGLVKDNNGSDTLDVAIKRAHRHPSKEGAAEVKYLERISHPNVIKLLGYCNKINKRKWIGIRRKEANIYLAVFEYMANGSLFNHLFSDELEPLSWAQRIKIANGSARALSFLHKLQIIHRDVKSANILLDSNFNSKLASFGSATDFYSHTEKNIIYGTFGYIAPEYIHYGELSEKIDVHGFGATLLEILSGQHVVYLSSNLQRLMSQELQSLEESSTSEEIQSLEESSRSQEIQSLEESSTSQEFQSHVDSSRKIYRDGNLQKFIISSTSDLKNLDNLMDPRLDRKYPLEAAHLAVQLALNCVDGDPNKRPSMEEAIKVLEHIQTIKMPAATSAPSRIISDPCDPLPCDLDVLVSKSMVYESAPFDADAELSFSIPRWMKISEPAPMMQTQNYHSHFLSPCWCMNR